MSHFRDDLSIIEAVSLGINGNQEIVKNQKGVRNCNERVDDTIAWCTSCGVVWEVEKNGYKFTQINHEDFPTIGKVRNDCPKCRFERGEKTFSTRKRGGSTNLPWSRFCFDDKKKTVRRSKTK